MVSDYRAIRPQGSPHIPPASSYCFFMEQVHSGSSVGREELGLNQPQPFHGYHHQQVPQSHPLPYPNPNPHTYPHPHPYHHPSTYAYDMHAAIQREIEKEKIREEIIMSEIMRRRELEAEVRRELMMERELVLRRGNHGVSYDAPSLTKIDLPKGPLEERIIPSITDREMLNGWHEIEPLPFQRGSVDVRNSEVILVTEAPKEKERVILGAKQNENTCGTKREASKVDASDSISGCKARKKVKEEWNCALCKVSSNSEHAMNEHLKGKKHKIKEAALKGAKKFSIGLLSKKPAITATIDPGTVYRAKVSLDKTTNDSDKLNKKEATMSAAVDPASVCLAKVPLDKTNNDADKLDKKEAAMAATVYRVKASLDKTKNDAEKLNKKEAVAAATVGPATVYRAKVSLDKTKNDTDKLSIKEKCTFWCEMCQVGASSQKVWYSHLKGKKHKHQLHSSNKIRGDKKLAE